MKLTIKNGSRYNLKKLKGEIGLDFRVTQEPHTITGEGDVIQYYDLEIAVNNADAVSAGKAASDLKAIVEAHAPELTDAEEARAAQDAAAEEIERPRFRKRLLKALEDADFAAKVKALLA